MPQVTTRQGIVSGILDGDEDHYLFAGIPYAKPPVGALRWKAPQRAEPWTGVLDCHSFRPICTQRIVTIPGKRWMCYGQEFFPGAENACSEDCLYLNLWSPSEKKRGGRRLPVLVIVHGGGYTTGSGSVPVLNGRNMSAEGMIVVTFNYRLGIFGFLAHPALSGENRQHVSGNYGILDQIAALQWVQENIAAFGGDPDCVTVAGESAGGGSVSILYQSPLARGLFQRAFVQSGAIFDQHSVIQYYAVTLANREQHGRAVLEKYGADTLEKMRALSAEQLLKISAEGGFGPLIDGYVLPGDYPHVFRPGNQNDVPLLLGSNSGEGLIFADPRMSEEDFIRELKARYGEKAGIVQKAYLNGKIKMPEAVFNERRDRIFEFHMYTFAKMQTRYGKSPVFLYYFDRAVPEVGYGAFHSSALEYFYRNLPCTDVHWEETDRELSDRMARYLQNFMITGDPNEKELPRWNAYSCQADEVMELGEHTGMIPKPHKECMRALEEVLNLQNG